MGDLLDQRDRRFLSPLVLGDLAQDAGRVAADDHVGRDVLGDDGAGTDGRVRPRKLAADMFMGTFSQKFSDAAIIACDLLPAVLYERYTTKGGSSKGSALRSSRARGGS